MLKTVSAIVNAVGALNYKGTWNASTNTPALSSGVGTKGDYYVVSVAGSTALDGISNWGVGDWVTFNGSVWQRVEGGADLNGVNLSVSGTATLSSATASSLVTTNASKELSTSSNTSWNGSELLLRNATATNGRIVLRPGSTGADPVYQMIDRVNALNLEFQCDTGVASRYFDFYGRVRPGINNNADMPLGDAAKRWPEVFAANGVINTSDGREKQDIAELSEAEKQVASSLKGLIRKFRFTEAVERKGDAARIHVGVIAQEVVAAFEAQGLDAMRYGIVCYDEWEETPEIKVAELDAELKETGRMIVVQQYQPAGNLYGIRYEQLLAFIIAAI
jgi:ribosomal protein L9